MRISKFDRAVIPVPARAYAPAGPHRLRHAGDAQWPPAQRAYGGLVDPDTLARIVAWGMIALRLAVPTLLTTLLLAIYLYADAPLRIAGVAPSALLTASDLIVPGCWMVIHLTNRRFGPAHAFGHLLAGLVLALLVAAINPFGFRGWMPNLAVLAPRAVTAFVLVFAIANFAGIVFFDAARGPRWWTAPLAGSVVAAFVFSGLYYPLAFGALGFQALAHFALFLGGSVVLMGAYFLLRPAMKPLSGMNGF